MRPRTASRLAWSVGALSIALMIGAVVLTFIDRHTVLPEVGDAWSVSHVFSVAVHVGIPVLGVLLATRRPENPIGWLFLAAGIALAFSEAARAYALHALVAETGTLPGGMLAGWVANAVWPIPISLLPFLLLLFPSGHLVSSRWRPVAWLAGSILVVLTGLAFAFATMSWARPFEDVVGVARGPFVGVMRVGFSICVLLVPVVMLMSVAAIAARYARAGGDERLQLKWFATAAALVAIALSVTVFYDTPLTSVLFDVSLALLYVAIGVAIFKYRLYGIDVVINKTVVYGLLAAFFTLVYVVLVVGLGTAIGSARNPFLTLAAAAVIAIAFNPVRERAKRLADRLVYGTRATPYEVLSQFSERMAGTYALDDILPRMAQVLAEGTGGLAEIWLRVGEILRSVASWPSEERRDGTSADMSITGEALPAFPTAAKTAPVLHQGELLGAISVTKPPNDPLRPAEDKLIDDVAAQAGLVLFNVRLIEQLRASRQRLVKAQDEERRRIERNIHDGAQQQLVALAVKANLAESFVGKDADKERALLSQLKAEATGALENLRDLARGIYPPLLADQGLAVALEAQARKSLIPVSVEADGIGRWPQEVEAAIYFCCLEALQNIAKYAEASTAAVRLESRRDTLTFEVIDDGAGFDPSKAGYGTGLQGIADRLDALGGSLEVRSATGQGTTVSGWVPSLQTTP